MDFLFGLLNKGKEGKVEKENKDTDNVEV